MAKSAIKTSFDVNAAFKKMKKQDDQRIAASKRMKENKMENPSLEIQKKWSIVSVGNPGLTFNYCDDTKFHNGSVRSTDVLCRKTDREDGLHAPLYFLLYKRPKKYWVFHLLTAKQGEGFLKVKKNVDGSIKHPVDTIALEAEACYNKVIVDLTKYDNASHKRK
jgi:hypothetical protein